MLQAQTRRIHLNSLTGLRFYAALVVVLYHISRYFEPMGFAAPVVGFGYTGVSFFFILSGFVLAWSSREGDAKAAFYWRRFARVWPLHALTTILAIIVAAIVGIPIVWQALPFVLTLTQAWLPPGDYRYAFNGVSWSLACEAFFYLLFPTLNRFIRSRRRLLAVPAVVLTGLLFVAAAGIAIAPERALGYLFYTMPAFRLGEFIVGICLAVAIQRGWRPRFTLRQALLGTAGLYAVLMAGSQFTLGSPELLPYVVADLVMLGGFVAVIAAAAAGDIRGDGGHFRSTGLFKLGQWSFALYLVHELVVKLADTLVDPLTTGPAAVASLTVVALSVALSGVLYERFERPIEARMRSWSPRRQASSNV
jgi:peptidoglycan/LPS O-acetylase OafA/YrhL